MATAQVLVSESLQADMGFGYDDDSYDPVLQGWEILHMQDRYLIEQIRLLDDRRASIESKEDALEWVAMPLVPGPEVPDLGPLSFQRCCLEAHEVDPAVMQERVLKRIAPEKLAALGYDD